MLFTIIDDNKSGTIELKEFIDILNISEGIENEEQNRLLSERLFEMIDIFKKGYMD